MDKHFYHSRQKAKEMHSTEGVIELYMENKAFWTIVYFSGGSGNNDKSVNYR